MEADDLLPNDGTYFMPREPVEQVVDRKRERAQSLEDLSLLKEIIGRFDRRIEFYSSVDAMPDDVKTDPVKFMNMHNSNQLTRDSLNSEREYLQSLLDNLGISDI